MKKLLGILVLSLFLITPSQADDIRDFEMEGVSLYDSALKYYNENQIKKEIADYYSSNKFFTAAIRSSLDQYDYLQLSFRTGDDKYIIVDLTGNVDKNYSDCINELDNLDKELSAMFSDTKKINKTTYPHPIDKSGETKITDIIWKFDSGDLILVQCYNWASSNFGKERNYSDEMKISISNKDFDRWMLTEAYE